MYSQEPTLYTVKAVLILDNDGERLYAKVHSHWILTYYFSLLDCYSSFVFVMAYQNHVISMFPFCSTMMTRIQQWRSRKHLRRTSSTRLTAQTVRFSLQLISDSLSMQFWLHFLYIWYNDMIHMIHNVLPKSTQETLANTSQHIPHPDNGHILNVCMDGLAYFVVSFP